MKHLTLRLFLFLIIISGCNNEFDHNEPLPQAVAHEIIIKSKSYTANPIMNLNLWAYVCDANGNVSSQSPVYHKFIDLTKEAPCVSHTTSLDFPRDSRYYRLVALSNYNNSYNPSIEFKQLATTKAASDPSSIFGSHWTILDTRMRDADGVNRTDLRLYPIPGKVSLQIGKATDAMRVLIKHVQIRSAYAPTQGAVLSTLTDEQIEEGDFSAEEWWYSGAAIEYEEDYLNEIAADVTLTGSKVYSDAGSALLFEHKEGWTDLSAFKEAGFTNIPQGNGYYMDIEYAYTTHQHADLRENGNPYVITVCKYIPLKPVLRGHHQIFKVMLNLDDIIVNGSTEISEEITGEW